MNFFSFYLFFFLIGLKFLCLIIINFLVLFCVFSYRNFSGFVNVQKTNQTVFPFKLGILKFKYNLFNNNSNYRKWYHQRVFQNCLLCHKYRDQKQSLGVFFFGIESPYFIKSSKYAYLSVTKCFSHPGIFLG